MEQKQPFGYLLNIRMLAMAACCLDSHPAALRVLCILAEYADADGKCRVGLDTVGARLDISRQGVQRHIPILIKRELLTVQHRPGRATLYRLGGDEVRAIAASERWNEEFVVERLAQKRQAKKAREQLNGVAPGAT